MAQLHDIQPNTPSQKKKRVGRGGTRGKTSGKGHKGQKARAGGTPRPMMRDIIKKIPKLRGHGKNRSKTVHDSRIVPVVVNIAELEATFDNGAEVNTTTLLEKGLIEQSQGKTPVVKILGEGDLSKSLDIVGVKVSKSAKESVEKAGGSVK